jgi:sulfite reductase alpha subunit-like flavoprotein
MKDFQISPEKVRLDYFLQIVGRQRVREYSISSFQPGKSVDLTMAVTEYKTKFERQITGVCSGYLKSIEQTYPVPCWLKKGTMDFTEKKPMIFVGPGTGVAAFRSAIQKYVGKTKLVLIFGCRSESDDYYYQEEWKSYGDNLKVISAFSREN